MKYISHTGKVVSVSDKRFNEFKRKEENNDVWLTFRAKQFGYCKEELIMNPASYMLFSAGMVKGVDGMLHYPRNEQGKPIVDLRTVSYSFRYNQHFAGGYYMGEMKRFDTPQEAYDYAVSLPLRKEEVINL